MIVIITFLLILIIVDLIFTLKIETNNRLLFYVNLFIFGLIVYLLSVNKYLWQITFVLLLALLLLVLFINRSNKIYPKIINHHGKLILTLSSFTAILLTILAFIFFPIPILPKHSWKNVVGTRDFTIGPNVCKDNIIIPVNENYSKPTTYKLVIKIWYPSELAKNKDRYAISKEEIVRLIKFGQGKSNNLLSLAFLPLNFYDSNSYLDAEISKKEKKYPIILYNGSLFSVIGQNSLLLEELASQGFIVISVGHPYGTVINYNDGSFITPKTKYIYEAFDLALTQASELKYQYDNWRKNGVSTYDADKAYFSQLYWWKVIVDQWEADNNCVIDYLAEKNNDITSDLFGKFDFTNIGVIGHSLGGYTAGNMCAHDPNIKACVFFDTGILSEYFFTGMEKPSLFIYANSAAVIDPYIKINPNSPIRTYVIKNTKHHNFEEQWLLAPYNFKDNTYNLFGTYKTLFPSYIKTIEFMTEIFNLN